MPDTTQDAGKAVVEAMEWLYSMAPGVSGMRQKLDIVKAYITALEERNRTLEQIRNYHADELAERNGSAE